MKRTHYLVLVLIALGSAGLWHSTHKMHVAPELLVEGARLPEDAPALPRVGGVAKSLTEDGDLPQGYIEYVNDRYKFSFYHSNESKIEETDEGDGAMTVTLENLSKGRGLQVFIVPYPDKKITLDRFLKDIPNGVRAYPKDTLVDGEPAITFNSYTPELGATREVWFLHNGYLYEVTTFQGIADWFVPIMKTWKFL